ncbi:hypothetical protein E6H32_02670 [Candidatus Bathyarchaeota archaeon]|nr:MAG: hypothetical protein E6H32_02670 [Candidatus Bathyarchaeota archaeon]
MIAVSRAQRTRSGSVATAIALVVLVGLGALLAARPFIAQATTVPPGQLPSWNPAVGCTAILTSIEGVIGSQRNANGGAAYGGGGFIPGVPDKRSTSPPCTVNGNATFVEIHGVQMLTLTYVVEDCAQYPNGNFCDTTFNFQDPKCASPDLYLCQMHMEIDQAWKSAGIASQNPPVTNQLFDIQGFVYWDNDHVNNSWHSFSGWEIHPISAWRFSSSPTPDFGLSMNLNKLSVQQGASSTATVTINSLDRFNGTVTLSASVTAKIANTTVFGRICDCNTNNPSIPVRACVQLLDGYSQGDERICDPHPTRDTRHHDATSRLQHLRQPNKLDSYAWLIPNGHHNDSEHIQLHGSGEPRCFGRACRHNCISLPC